MRTAVSMSTMGMLLLSAVICVAQDDDRTRAAATFENCRLEAAHYSIRTSGDRSAPFALNGESLLKWQNNVNKIVHGNVFVWTKDGRPEVVASIFQFYSPRVEFSAEFQSLSLAPLEMTRNGKTVWTPKTPGVKFLPFEEPIAPAETKTQRLRQMRQLAGLMTVEMTDYMSESYRLRLLPQPLLRYDSAAADVLDGALFAFTHTTDPDVLLMIEARKSGARHRWFFGAARMNVGALKVLYHDREVWKVEQLEQPFWFPEGDYTIFKDLTLPKPKPLGA